MAVSVAVAYLLILCCIPAGKIGDVYPRVSSPLQSSLVLGTSRAAQGVNPDILNERLREHYPDCGLYNFSFHLDETTYNEIYYHAVLKKLKPDNSRGFFILTVDPWAFKRDNEIIGELDLRSVADSPNIEYLVRFFNRTWISPLPTHVFINASGRSIVSGIKRSDAMVESKIRTYREMASHFAYSDSSEQVFVKLADELRKRGDVYMVRMPVSEEMVALEDSIMPGFSQKMSDLSKKLGVRFFDFIHEPFETNDGNHLTKEEGDRFSSMLADSICLSTNEI